MTIIATPIGGIPIGTIIDFAGPNNPAGYLDCDGSAVSRTAYAALFAAIGTTWGSGDGSTTFNVPDLRSRTAIGAGQGSGLSNRILGTQNIGEESHTLTGAEMPPHTHGMQNHTHNLSSHTHSLQSHTHSLQSHTHGMQSHKHLYGIHMPSYYGAPAADAAHIEIGNYKTGQWQRGTRGGSGSYVVNGAASASTKTVSADWYANEGYTAGPDNNTTTGPSNNTSGGPSNNTSGGPSNNTSGTPSNNTTTTATSTGDGGAISIMQPSAVVRKLIRAE